VISKRRGPGEQATVPGALSGDGHAGQRVHTVERPSWPGLLGQEVQGTRSWDALMGSDCGMQSWEYCAQILSVKHGGEVKHHAGGRHLPLGVDAVLDPIVDLLICGAADLSPVALGTGLLPFATEDAGRISQWEAPRLPDVPEEMLACSRYVETRRRRREASLPMASKRRRGRR